MQVSEERIIELETRIAYQEDTLQKLNDIVGAQQLQIEQIETALRVLTQRYRDMADNTVTDVVDERPPHY